MDFERMNGAEVEIENSRIVMRADGGTNLFNGVSGTWKEVNFPYHYTIKKGDFLVRCKVDVDFSAVYDLGSLVIYENENLWIKFAYENSDAGTPVIVTVVTREISDDCNGETIKEGPIWLQICRQGNVFAMHYSVDKVDWKLARICSCEMADEVKVGISAQCPSGDGCTAYFSEFELVDNPYTDIRSLK